MATKSRIATDSARLDRVRPSSECRSSLGHRHASERVADIDTPQLCGRSDSLFAFHIQSDVSGLAAIVAFERLSYTRNP